jgi:glycosyltransferase involved in cell wall biosynthesis
MRDYDDTQQYGNFIRNLYVIGSTITDSKITYYTLTMNRKEYTVRMMKSLEENSTVSYTHVFVDQGSTDGTVEELLLQAIPAGSNCQKRLVVSLRQNLGISAGSNLALDYVGQTPYVCKIDNDCEIQTRGFDAAMIAVCEDAPSPMILSPYVKGLRENKGGAPRYANVEFGGHPVGLTNHIGGICCFSSAFVHLEFSFDESDTLSGSQDSSFSSYVAGNGGLIGYVEDIFCEHMDTTQGQHSKFPEYFDTRERYDSKVSFTELRDD